VTHVASTGGGFGMINSAWAASEAGGHAGVSLELTLMAASVVIALCGITLAYILYLRKPDLPGRFTARFARLYHTVNNKYFVDELYDFVFVRGMLKIGALLLKVVDNALIEGAVNGTAAVMQRAGGRLRRIETGYVQEYALGIILGAIIVIGYLMIMPIL
jgi:NADH-quinone oxidoreductase subunit L